MTVNTLGSHESRSTRTVAEWLWPFVPMAVSVFSGSALVYYHLYQHVIDAHSPLQRLFAGIYRTIGFAPAVMFFGLAMVWSTIWLAAGRLDRPVARFARLLAMAVMLGVFLNLGDGAVSPEPHKGALGAWLAQTLDGLFGYWPSLLLVWGVTFASLLLATDFFFYESFEKLRTAPPVRETGVETAVTDHFRALADMAPAAAPAVAATAAPAAPAPVPAVAAAAATAAAAPIDLDVAVDEAAIEPPARRPSYAERRAEREARRWGAETDEAWVPGSPESQEIDDPEVAAAGANPAAVAPADSAATPADEDDLLVLPPLADEDFANEDDDDAVPATNEPEVLVSSSRHEPIVFPDEDVPAAEAPRDAVPAAELREPEPEPEPAITPEDAIAPEATVPAPERPVGDEAEDEVEAEVEADAPIAGEPVVNIPRPAVPPEPRVPEPAAAAPERELGPESEHAARQKHLFAAHLDAGLVREAIELVTSSRRASVAFLQRKLRIDYPLASDVLAELAARGVVALDGDATQGRVLG
jgi:hypothetical protein